MGLMRVTLSYPKYKVTIFSKDLDESDVGEDKLKAISFAYNVLAEIQKLPVYRRVINIDEDTFFLVSIISKLKFRLVVWNNRVSGVKLFCYKSYSPIWSIEVKGIAENLKIILSKLKQDMKDEYVDNLMVKLSSHLISVLSIVS
jgi:hypothetical protein